MEENRYTLVKKAMELESDIQWLKDKIKELKYVFGVINVEQESELANLYEKLWYKQKQLRDITDKLV